ncbi:hypothetical protein BV20DRAFT_984955 [Pilatotrama ljubarskyi]|nr:hypothetical protein BV20DRAFT_984955 [Pilatotrama ljubarskyi]
MSAAIQSSRAAGDGKQVENSFNNGVNASASPTNREDTLRIPASQPAEREDVDQSNGIALLATYGIHVRDFAYENTLPPVTTVPRFSVQKQPRSRALKRTRDMLEVNDGEESDVEDPSIPRTWYIDSSGTGTSRKSRYRKRAQALARTLTEPADDIPQSQGLNTREGGFMLPPSQRPFSPGPSSQSQDVPFPTTPRRPDRQAQANSLSPLTIVNNVSPSQVSHQGESQETESWIDTPLVTPNGSLQWPTIQNTSALPASQLESVLPQFPAEDDVTLSQLGFSPERSQPQHRAVPFAQSPAGTPSPLRQDAQLPPPAAFRHRTPSPTKSRHASTSPPRRSPRLGHPEARQEPRSGSPRYHLRQRPPGGANATTNGRGAAVVTSGRATSRTRASNQSARKTENTAPVRKKHKVSPPPADPPARTTRYGLRKSGDVEAVS